MLNAYKIKNNCLAPIDESTGFDWLEDAVWVDLVNPTAEEINTVELFSGISLPNIQETEEIEASSLSSSRSHAANSHCEYLRHEFPLHARALVAVGISAVFVVNDLCGGKSLYLF